MNRLYKSACLTKFHYPNTLNTIYSISLKWCVQSTSICTVSCFPYLEALPLRAVPCLLKVTHHAIVLIIHEGLVMNTDVIVVSTYVWCVHTGSGNPGFLECLTTPVAHSVCVCVCACVCVCVCECVCV